MSPSNITITVAVDAEYITKLRLTYPTWIKFKPALLDMKLCIIYDSSQMTDRNSLFDMFLKHKAGVELVPWTMNASSQREKMLTSLVFMPPECVKTGWYLKLDADTLANERMPWIENEWFAPSNGKNPVIVSSPWGYTKPGNLLDIMDDWGDTVDELKSYPRLNIPHAPGSKTVSSLRFASWVMFGNTDWTREIVKTCPDKRLPIPSQDTFLYYCAARRKDYVKRVRMSQYGWSHISKMKGLVPECEKLMGSDTYWK